MHPKGADSTAVSELSFRNTLIGSKWVSVVLVCMNGLTKQSFCLEWCPFPARKHFESKSERAVAG